MNDNGCISIQSRGLPITGNEVDQLAQLCRENNIEFENGLFRTDSMQASALLSWVTVYFTPETINAIVTGTISTVTGTLIATALVKIFQVTWNKFHSTDDKCDKHNNNMTTIELKSPSARLRTTSDKATAETLQEAIQTFLRFHKSKQAEMVGNRQI